MDNTAEVRVSSIANLVPVCLLGLGVFCDDPIQQHTTVTLML